MLDAAFIGRQKWNTKSNRRAWGLPKDRASDGLYTELQKARNATTDGDSAKFWHQRQQLHLEDADAALFAKVGTPRMLFLTCRRKDAAEVNQAYMRTLKACCRCTDGTATTPSDDDLKAKLIRALPQSIKFELEKQNITASNDITGILIFFLLADWLYL